MSPIIVRNGLNPTGVFLVAGAHRLAASKKLGRIEIPCTFVEEGGADRHDLDRLAELDENLQRAELTTLERSDFLAEREGVVGRLPKGISGQLVQKLKTPGNPKGAGRSEGGVSDAARQMGEGRKTVERAIKIASIEPDAKEVAREVGLDDNQAALLKVAKAPPERQAEAVRELAREKAERPRAAPASPAGLSKSQILDGAAHAQLRVLLRAWAEAGEAVRREFLARVT